VHRLILVFAETLIRLARSCSSASLVEICC
jgi:hypothetical protein